MFAKDSDFEDVCVKVNKVYTRIIQYGIKHLIRNETDVARDSTIILMISGNPGEIGYYSEFLSAIHSKTNLPVIGLSHGGHNDVCKYNLNNPKISGNYDLYSLESQISHKIAFINQFISSESKLVLIGHSIGCYIILEILHRSETIKSNVLKSILIFPTIESIGDTSEGRKYTFLFRYMRYPLLALAYMLQFLSDQTKQAMISWVTTIKSQSECDKPPNCALKAATNLFNPNCLLALIHMSLIEFETVKNLNTEAVDQNKNILTFLYGEADAWCPIERYEKMVNLFPDVDIRLCLKHMRHAFVLHANTTEQIARITSHIINSCTL